MYKKRPQQLQGIQGRTNIKEAGSSYSKSGNGKRKDGNNWRVSEDFQEKELSYFFFQLKRNNFFKILLINKKHTHIYT